MDRLNYWQRVTASSDVSRRAFLRSAAVTGVGAAAFLAGCRSTSSTPAANGGAAGGSTAAATALFAVPEGKRGGTITVSGTEPTLGWDTHQSTSTVTGNVLDQMNIKLIRHDYRKTPGWKTGADEKLLGELAEKWESPDPLTYNFTLRQGINWPDQEPMKGRPITTEDVAYAFAHGMQPTSIVQGYVWGNFASMTAIDAKTVQLKLKAPNWDIVNIMDSYNTHIMPKGVYEWAGPDGMKSADKTRGGGPYILEEYQPGSVVRFKANEAYRKVFGTPYSDKLVMAILVSGAPQLQAFSGKKTQFFTVPTGQLDTVKTARPDAKSKIDGYSSGNTHALWMNTLDKPFDDIRVRRAISMAVDREGWGKTLKGDYKLENGPISWAYPQWKVDPTKLPAETAPFLQYNLAEAKKLLAAAGVSSSTEFTVNNYEYDPSYTAGAGLMVDYLQKLGITAKIKQYEYNNWIATAYRGQYTGGMVYTQHALDRVSEQLVDRFAKNGTRNQSNVQDDATQQLVKDFWGAKGPTEAKPISDKLQIRSIDQAFAVYRPVVPVQVMWDPAIQNYEGEAAVNWTTQYRTSFYWQA